MRTRARGKALALGALSIVSGLPALVAPTSEACAFERQWHAGAGLGLMTMRRGDETGSSLGGDLSLVYGLTDQLNAMVEVTGAPYVLGVDPPPGTDPKLLDGSGKLRLDDTFFLLTANAGISYVLDVIRWVPYAGVLVGTSRLSWAGSTFGALRGTGGAEMKLDTVVALGLDYQLTREWALGGAIRAHTSLFSHESTQAAHILFRGQYTWGY
jgi:hypothetical protein